MFHQVPHICEILINGGEAVALTVRVDAGAKAGRRLLSASVDIESGAVTKRLVYKLKMTVEPLVDIQGDDWNLDFGDIDLSRLPVARTIDFRRGSNPLPWDALKLEREDGARGVTAEIRPLNDG